MTWRSRAALVLAAGLAATPTARAEDVARRGTLANLPADPQAFADGDDALPGVGHLAAAGPLARGIALAVATGYGFRGATLGAEDHHHRGSLVLAASFRPTAWLALSGRFAGRYDVHRGGERDRGWVGDPRLAARASRRLGILDLGAQVGLWLPGSDAPSVVPAAASPEALVLAGLAPAGPWAVAVQLGARLDRSAASVTGPEMLSEPDRLALGVGRGPVVLAALGGRLRGAAGELHGEVSWDLRLGDQAPPSSASPLRIGAGVRRPIGGVEAGARLQALLSRAPSVAATAPLAPVEPTIALVLSLTWRSPGERRPPVIAVRPRPARPAPSVVVVMVESNGGPVAGAEVVLTLGGARQRATSDDTGQVRFTGGAGAAEIAVTREGYQATTIAADLRRQPRTTVPVTLEPRLPPGQLRGGVRSARGRPLEAHLLVAPIGLEVRSDARGEFQVDLPPGAYQVTLTAEGFKPQTREVQIEQDGVTILNVDMRR